MNLSQECIYYLGELKQSEIQLCQVQKRTLWTRTKGRKWELCWEYSVLANSTVVSRAELTILAPLPLCDCQQVSKALFASVNLAWGPAECQALLRCIGFRPTKPVLEQLSQEGTHMWPQGQVSAHHTEASSNNTGQAPAEWQRPPRRWERFRRLHNGQRWTAGLACRKVRGVPKIQKDWGLG